MRGCAPRGPEVFDEVPETGSRSSVGGPWGPSLRRHGRHLESPARVGAALIREPVSITKERAISRRSATVLFAGRLAERSWTRTFRARSLASGLAETL